MLETKYCSRCGQTKNITEFCKDRQTKSGLACYCRACHKMRAAKYLAKPLTKLHRKRYSKTYYHRNRAKIIEQTQEYHKTPKGKEVARLAYAKWQASEHGRHWRKAWCKSHPDIVRAAWALKCAIRTGKIARSMYCQSCNSPCRTDAHHHKGYAKEHWLDIIWLCRRCHARTNRAQLSSTAPSGRGRPGRP